MGMKKSQGNIDFKIKTEKFKQYLKIIPSDAKVSASNNIAAHLSEREWIFVLPYGMDNADFIVIHNEEKFNSIVNRSNYDLVTEDLKNNFYIYKKRLNTNCNYCNP